MKGKKLWAQFWSTIQKQSKRSNHVNGLNFLKAYEMTEPKNVLIELQAGLGMTIKGKYKSGYVVILPNTTKNEELIRNRLANHPFELSEWPEHEIDGLPNRRYSIFIYDDSTCPQYSGLSETKWRMEYSEGIPIYEKGFNVAFLKRTFAKLKRILISIYKGGTPQPAVLKPITNESKIYKNMKQKIKLNESKLRAIIAESVKRVLNEDMFDDGGYSEETMKNISWAKKEALEKLQYIKKEFEKLPENALAAYKVSNIAMTRLAIQQIQRIHSFPYKEEPSSLSMQQRQGLGDEF